MNEITHQYSDEKNVHYKYTTNYIRVLFVLFILFVNCSEETQNSVTFIPELKIGENDTDNVWFGSITSFYIGPKENIFCLDGQEKKIKVFNKHGNFLYDFGREGSGPGKFLNPNCIVVSSDNMVYISDNQRRTISKFTKNGQFLTSKSFEHILVKMGIFNSGNLLVEIAEIDIRDIKSSKYKLYLFDNNFYMIKDSLYEQSVSNLTWIDTSDGKMFTVQIPFAPQLIWKIIDNKLYVGYNNIYYVTVFDENGTYLNKITKEVERQKVTSTDKQNWIKNMIDKFSNRPNLSIKEMKKSLEKADIPRLKPAFTKIVSYNNDLLILENPTKNGTPGILHDKNGNEVEKLLLNYNDLEYYFGKYYRITGGDDKPFTLTRYRGDN